LHIAESPVSKPVNKTMLGGFVVAAIALFVAAVLVFGSSKFFKETVLRVMYFQGSVKGLNVGAPVLFRGVKIGSVKEISLHWDLEKKQVDIPVIVEIQPDKFNVVGGTLQTKDPAKENRELIEQGLRARLETQSFVTGQLLITLDFNPDTPVTLHKDAPYLEIPTIPTTLQQIEKTLQELDLKGMVEKLASAVESVDRLVSSPELKDSVVNLDLLLKDTRKLVQNLDRQVDPLASDLKGAIGDARKVMRTADDRIGSVGSGAVDTLADARKLINNVDSRVASIEAQLQGALEAATQTFQRAETTLETIEGATKSDSQLMYRLTKALDEFESLARSIRVLADYLERHPEALIKGKGSPGGK
jgi:paraquat-inducible protein B